MKQKPNKLGWVTQLSIDNRRSFADITAFGDIDRTYIPAMSTVEADLHIVAENPGALMETFQDWLHGGINMPTYQKEFMCLYCGSPNKIEHTHCAKCGAPRSFVIG
jgi:hypothetical protein